MKPSYFSSIVILVLLSLVIAPVAISTGIGTIEDQRNADDDKDGFRFYEDCDDNNITGPQIHPNATDIGDGIDNNCDGIIDPDLPDGWTQVVGGDYTAGGVRNTSGQEKVLIMQGPGRKAIRSDLVPAVPGAAYRGGVFVNCSVGSASFVIESWTRPAPGQLRGTRTELGGPAPASQPTILTSNVVNARQDSGYLSVMIYTTSDISVCQIDNPFLLQGGEQTPTLLSSQATPASCCAANSCWNGTTCVSNQLSNSLASSGGFRCENGLWVNTNPKFTPNRGKKGFCPLPTQCLYQPDSPATSEANNQPHLFFASPKKIPNCIAANQSIKDDFCENGNWSTRTKLVALQLFQYLGQNNDYVMFCDNLENVFGQNALVSSTPNFMNQCSTPSGTVPCVNNVCVASYAGKSALGTSLNTAHNDPNGLLAYLGDRTVCNGAANAQGYSLCGTIKDGDYAVWFNNQTQSLIITPSDANIQSIIDFAQVFLQNIFNPLGVLWEYVLGSASDLYSYSFFSSTSAYNKIYAAKQGDKKVFAFLEEDKYENGSMTTGPFDYIGIKYENFDANPCALFAPYNSAQHVVLCNSTGTTIRIATAREANENNPLIDAWVDITAKLRLT